MSWLTHRDEAPHATGTQAESQGPRRVFVVTRSASRQRCRHTEPGGVHLKRTPIGPTDTDSEPSEEQKPLQLPTVCSALAETIAPPARNTPLPRIWTVTLFTVVPSQVRNPGDVGFCGENGPADMVADPELTVLPCACDIDTVTLSVSVVSPGFPIGAHTTLTGTDTRRRSVTLIGDPIVTVIDGVVAPAEDTNPNTAMLHASIANTTPDKILRFMADPSDLLSMRWMVGRSSHRRSGGTMR